MTSSHNRPGSFGAALLGALTLFAVGGCGELYADLDVRTVQYATTSVVPQEWTPGMTGYVEVKVPLDGALHPYVESAGFVTENGAKLVAPEHGVWAGQCPDWDVHGVTPDEVDAVVLAEDKVLTSPEGAFLFCTAIEIVGEYASSTTLDIPIVYWDGRESVFSRVTLYVTVTP